MRIAIKLKRSDPARQRVFEFLRRTTLRERWFKRSILAATGLTIALILGLLPRGRYLVASAASECVAPHGTRSAFRRPARRSTTPGDVTGSWDHRFATCAGTRLRRGRSRLPTADAVSQGSIPSDGLLRWGNFNRDAAAALDRSSKPTIRDAPTGCVPDTRSIWLRNLTLKSGVLMFFLVPDGPGLADAIRGTPAIPVETSQADHEFLGAPRVRSPIPRHPCAGIVLGDSFMQGMFIGDDETPPECLRRYLEDQLEHRVSILNTGVMGYSPEQYYYSLLAFAERFRPQFVVVSVFTNDFGDLLRSADEGHGRLGRGEILAGRRSPITAGHGNGRA